MNMWQRCRRLVGTCAIAWVSFSSAIAQSGPEVCGNPFINHYGPYDYRTAGPTVRKIVEEVHFTPGIETMTRPKNTMFHEMGQDVEYTLSVFPNHHRALITMERLSIRWKQDPAPGSKLPVECWFDRAVRYRPDDTVARALFAQFLGRRNRSADAVRHLEFASDQAKENALSQYNIGLVFLELGQHERALRQAHRALSMGYTRTDLADSLKKIGKWADPATN